MHCLQVESCLGGKSWHVHRISFSFPFLLENSRSLCIRPFVSSQTCTHLKFIMGSNANNTNSGSEGRVVQADGTTLVAGPSSSGKGKGPAKSGGSKGVRKPSHKDGSSLPNDEQRPSSKAAKLGGNPNVMLEWLRNPKQLPCPCLMAIVKWSHGIFSTNCILCVPLVKLCRCLL